MYITPDEFLSSMLLSATDKTFFEAMTDDDKMSIIYRASVYIDLAYQGRIKGEQDPNNDFSFPRLGQEDIPKAVKSSTIIVASMLASGADLMGASAQTGAPMSKVKVGSIAIDYAISGNSHSIATPPVLIDQMMMPLLCESSNSSSFNVMSYL